MSVFAPVKRRWLWFAVGVYLILISGSTVARWSGADKLFPESKKSITVFAVENGEQINNTPVRFAYREFLPPVETGQKPIILLHGNPGDSSVLIDLAKDLSLNRRVIVPDLPGFGDSTREIPDYGIRAHALYIRQFADAIELKEVHLLGFSMGGGVALNFYDIAPERIASIEMVSAIGVQEYELLGDYNLNHVLHATQFGAIWILQNLVPHFGLLDDFPFDTSYARTFYDSDQRSLRTILQKIESPVLIVHGAKDPLVPVQAAREHHRLVPQSEYHEFDDNHFMVFMRPQIIAPVVADFLERVEAGQAQIKATADAERASRATAPFHRETVMADGSTAIVFFLIIALATFISEDLTCLTAGALAGQGQISLELAIAACAVGIFSGDLLLYFAGRFLGRRVVSRAPVRWFVSENSLKRGAAWLERNGLNAVFLSRLTPGLRLPIYFAAGMLRTNFFKFTLFFAIAALIWTPVLVGATAWASGGMRGTMADSPVLSRSFWIGILGIVITAFVLLNLILRIATWRGRRMLVGTYLRWTKWEFWSLQTFYLPIIAYIGWLAIKFRSPSVFADANPFIEASGFVGESKAEIYEALRATSAAKSHLLRYILVAAEIENDEKLKIIETFRRENALDFPIAFKPNAGERGAGVFIVKTLKELENRIAASKTNFIVQEYAAGDEFGVFYYRYPNKKRGQIFAITEKVFPSVTGDGEATLEALILRDKRAVALADAYFERNADRLDYVPAVGEIVQIIDIGTHSKGAIFLDGGELKTVELEAEIDRVCRGCDGFYFGRFDLRAASKDEFRKGNFKIIELNGVTSEATSIYDPKNSLVDAYRVLFRQWRIAFEIGAQNRAAGAPPTSVWKLLTLYYRSRFSQFVSRRTKQNEQSEIQNPQSPIEDVPDSFRV